MPHSAPGGTGENGQLGSSPLSNSAFSVLDVGNVPDMLKIARLTSVLSQASPLGMMAFQLSEMSLKPDTYQVYNRSGTVPAWAWFRFNRTLVVVIDGVTTALQGAALADSYTKPMRGQDGWKAVGLAYQDASTIVNVLDSIHTLPAMNLLVAGYSYGGCLAECIAAMVTGNQLWPNLELLTFGSPRPGDEALALRLRSVPTRRLMNDDDPVPRFPPHANEAWLATSLLPFPIAYLLSLYCQPQGGIQLSDSGQLTATELPSRFLPIADVDLVQWVVSTHGMRATSHSISTYVERLKLAVAPRGAGAAAAVASKVVEVPKPLSITEFNALVTLVAGGVGSTSSQEKSMAGYIPPKFRPRTLSVQGLHYVYWMGVPIATCKTASAAKTIAKYLFKMLRTWQTDGQVNVTGFNQAWTSFMSSANLGGLGFSPPFITY